MQNVQFEEKKNTKKFNDGAKVYATRDVEKARLKWDKRSGLPQGKSILR